MLEIVANRGYGAVTVRGLVRTAGVSTRAFYEHFDGAEDCFLRTHELLARRVVRRMVASQAGEDDWRMRVRHVFRALIHELEADPRAARLMLVDGYGGGPAAIDQIQRTQRTLEEGLEESFASAPEGAAVPPLLTKGMIGGAVSVARSRLLAGREDEFPQLADRLTVWALELHSGLAAGIVDLDRRHDFGESGHATPATQADDTTRRGRDRAPAGDRELILIAAAKIVAADGYDALTVQKIRAAAGAPRRSFTASFDGVDDCYVKALELYTYEALARAGGARASGSSWADGLYRAAAAICADVANDPVLAGLCFGEIHAAATEGALCRERLVQAITRRLRKDAPGAWLVDDLALEASIGAVWGILHHCVATGRAWQAHQAVAVAAYLLTAPITGPQAAVPAPSSPTTKSKLENVWLENLPDSSTTPMVGDVQGELRHVRNRNEKP